MKGLSELDLYYFHEHIHPNLHHWRQDRPPNSVFHHPSNFLNIFIIYKASINIKHSDKNFHFMIPVKNHKYVTKTHT